MDIEKKRPEDEAQQHQDKVKQYEPPPRYEEEQTIDEPLQQNENKNHRDPYSTMERNRESSYRKKQFDARRGK